MSLPKHFSRNILATHADEIKNCFISNNITWPQEVYKCVTTSPIEDKQNMYWCVVRGAIVAGSKPEALLKFFDHLDQNLKFLDFLGIKETSYELFDEIYSRHLKEYPENKYIGDWHTEEERAGELEDRKYYIIESVCEDIIQTYLTYIGPLR